VCAVLNSETLANVVAPYQSRGQFGARDFDLYVWYVAVREFVSDDEDHQALAVLGERAEQVAAGSSSTEACTFKPPVGAFVKRWPATVYRAK
jgi:hypothetical protein